MNNFSTNITRNLLVIGLLPFLLHAQFVEDVFNKYTSVNQLGMTVTNFGVLGNGWNKINGQILPSCQYKQHTEILQEQVEHFPYAGLWIGGIVNGQRRVSTAIVDGVFEYGQEGFELFAASGIEIQSSIASTAQDTMAQYYSPYAISHQDFLTDFSDYGSSASDANGIPNHIPLGIEIHLESYAWKLTYAESFVILNITITNASTDVIQNLYAGYWVDPAVANMNYTNKYEPGGGFSWYDNLNGFDQSIDDAGFTRDIAYQYDADGDDGWAESYIGVSLLGGTVPQPYVNSYYSQWVWTSSNNSDYPQYSMPLTDSERYAAMKTNVPKGTGIEYTNEGYPSAPNNWLFLFSAGPLGSQPTSPDSSSWELQPGDSCNIVFAVVAARWNGTGEDSPVRRNKLKANVDRAQSTYDGEDTNRNNVLDSGEDIDGDGNIDRYLIPADPPHDVTADWNYPTVTLTWEPPYQPVIGYSIYRSRYNSEFYLISIITDTVFVDSDVNEDSVTAYYVLSINEWGLESTPSNIIKDYSAPPSINFRYQSNPLVSDIQNDTSFTFPTRTFMWDITDPDGIETIDKVYYSLDDTTEWIELAENQHSVTLENIPDGSHIFYLKAKDNFGLFSTTIFFPDSANLDEPNHWEVMPVTSNVLLVDDFVTDSQNNAQNWYRSILDTIIGPGNYSIWEIGNKLPYSPVDITANLNYFDHVIWYTAYSGTETYLDASSSILSYLMGGGNLFLNATELKDATFTWFPLDSSFTLNPSGRILPSRTLMSQVSPELNLETSSLIAVRVKGFEPDNTQFANVRTLYRLQEPDGGDEWTGTPNVCSIGQFRIPTNQLLSGEIVLMSIPLHNGYSPLLDGNGSASKFIQYLLEDEFTPRPNIDPVYPGDTDNNGTVEALDILPIGIYFLQEGIPRGEIGVTWIPHEIPLWNLFPSTYADANGDGIVDEKDIIAIGVNWLNTHDVNGQNTFTINVSDTDLLLQNRAAFQHIYNSLSGESEAVVAMKKLLESILDIHILNHFSLQQNYPNPFNPKTAIQFSLPDAQSITLIVYNILGQVVTVLVDNIVYDAGFHIVEFDATRLSSGVYFYRIETNEWSAIRKLVVLK